jgi:hypothetical protein
VSGVVDVVGRGSPQYMAPERIAGGLAGEKFGAAALTD